MPGKDVAFNGYRRLRPDTGHTSIGLFDTDRNAFVIKGFYPENPDKMSPKSARAAGRIRDDKDRVKEKANSLFFFEISDMAYAKLTDQVKTDSKIENTPEFDLYNYNCTDYAIQLAGMAGIMLPDPQGSFGDFGTGSNPNMFGNAMDEYMVHQKLIRDDEIRKLNKLLAR